jgi:hypothetical protein
MDESGKLQKDSHRAQLRWIARSERDDMNGGEAASN